MFINSKFSTFDHIYRSILLTKFFTEGWGRPENLRKLFLYRNLFRNRETFLSTINLSYPISLKKKRLDGSLAIIDGSFQSPFAHHFPDLVEPPVNKATFQMIVPENWSSSWRPLCIHLAGTGDHNFWRRRYFMAKPLVKENIASILLENPFYGCRKPKQQKRSSLRRVTDLLVMGGCLILETLTLLRWCEQNGFWPLVLTGISMGGHGVMSGSIPWNVLQSQFESSCETVWGYNNGINEAIMCGRRFAQNYPHSIDGLELLQRENLIENNVWNLSEQNSSSKYVKSSPCEMTSAAYKAYRNATKSDVMYFMQGVMDDFTHLGNYSKPVDQSLVIVVTAGKDAYVPRDGVTSITEIWPEAEVRVIPESGHVQANIFYHKHFRRAILDSVNRTLSKYSASAVEL